MFTIFAVVIILGSAFFFFHTSKSGCQMLPDGMGQMVEVCPVEMHALIGTLLPPSQMGHGGPGVIAGIRVTDQFPSGIFSLNSNATTTRARTAVPDTDLDPSTMRVVSVQYPVLVQKPDGVHVEYVYNAGIVAPEDAAGITEPRLVSGGVVFRDESGTARVFALGDGGTIAGLPASKTLTFVASSTRYLSDARGVYFFTYARRDLVETAKDVTALTVQGADTKTFTVLYGDANFAKDADHFFLNGNIVPDITPQSVRPLPHRDDASYFSGVDTRYYDAQWLYTIGFAMLPEEQYAGRRYQDKGTIAKESLKNMYYRTVDNVDPKKEEFTRYTVVSGGVSYNGAKISGADGTHFELIVGLLDLYKMKGGMSYEYARDSASVYYGGERIPNADRDTFLPLPLNPAYATDKSHVYFGGQVIADADPTTFESLWFPVYEGCTLGMYARDAYHVYYKDQIVEGADPKSFRALLEDYGRDAKGIYLKGIFHKEVNPHSFTEPVCNYG